MKKSLTIVMIVLLVSLVVACSPEHKHTMDAGKQTTDPTCTKDGVMTYTCTSCGYEETKSIPATGHIKPDASKWQPADSEDNNAVTCYTDGIYEYRCTVCGAKDTVVVTPKMAKDLGLSYEHVTRVGNKYVHILNDDHTALNVAGNVTESAVEYDSSKVTAETMFVPKTKIAYCATCGDELGALNEVVKSEKDVATYKKMVGTWVFTDNSDSEATKIYYLNVEEKEDNGTLTGKTNYVKSSLAEGVWSTTTATSTPTYSSLFTTETSGIRSMELGSIDGSRYYKISESVTTGDWTLTSYGNSDYNTDPRNELKIEGKTLKFRENHLHGYNTDASKSDSIAKDTSLVPMTYLGYNYASSDGKHYVACSTCGLSYYNGNHDTAAADGSCSVCGYNASNCAEVTITCTIDPVISALMTDFENNSTVFATASDSNAIEKLTKAKDLLEKTLEVLTESGCEDDIVTEDIPALLKESGAGVDKDNSVVYALAAAKTSGGDQSSDSYNTVLTRVLKILGESNSGTYDVSESSAWKLLKSYTDEISELNTGLTAFYVEKGGLLALDSKKYTPFNAATIKIADGTSWSGAGYVQSTDKGFKVRDKCTLTFALEADLSE